MLYSIEFNRTNIVHEHEMVQDVAELLTLFDHPNSLLHNFVIFQYFILININVFVVDVRNWVQIEEFNVHFCTFTYGQTGHFS